MAAASGADKTRKSSGPAPADDQTQEGRTQTATPSRKWRILIVDDHPVVLLGLRGLLARESDLEICGEADDVESALRTAEATAPDAAIVDISLRGKSGLELIERLKASLPAIRILVSSIHDETLLASRVLRAGALGYICKGVSLEALVEALRQVLRGEVYLSPRMARQLSEQVADRERRSRDPVQQLSNRELEVFALFGQGQTAQQIARRLNVSAKTVETHRKNIKIKLGLQNSAQLARMAFQWTQEQQG